MKPLQPAYLKLFRSIPVIAFNSFAAKLFSRMSKSLHISIIKPASCERRPAALELMVLLIGRAVLVSLIERNTRAFQLTRDDIAQTGKEGQGQVIA